MREVETEISAQLLPQMEDGDTTAARLDGTLLGKVSRVQGRSRARVTDEAALVQWVRERYPSEIDESVRPAFRDKLLASAKVHGAAVDETTGELVPGVELSVGDAYLSFRSQPGCDTTIADNLSTLAGQVLLESDDDEEVQR